MYGQLVAYGRIQSRAQPTGFIDLGDNATYGRRTAIAGIGASNLVQGVAMAGGIQDQQAIDPPARTGQHGRLLGNIAVALADPHVIDPYGLFRGDGLPDEIGEASWGGG